MKNIKQGIKANWQQFLLLILVNVMLGGMVGMERTILPLIGSEVFGLQSDVVIFSFIIVFGLVKAFANLASGALADKYSRKRVLVAGWVVGIPIPFLLAYGPSWNWILLANVLLGVSQGLAWSMTLNMKIDLAGKKFRGLATGINEAAGYGAVGLTALFTGYIASSYGLRPQPFYIGFFYTAIGLILSVTVIRDTRKFAHLEAAQTFKPEPEYEGEKPKLKEIFKSFVQNKNLLVITQAGHINNFKDGMVWGVFPLLFVSLGVHIEGVGWIKAIYPIIWGFGQIITGPLSDKVGRKPLIEGGMLIQAAGLIIISLNWFDPFISGMVGSALLGVGTAMVYPALVAAVSDAAHPATRASNVGIYRFLRDLGYALGALTAGIVGNILGLMWAIHITAFLTLVSGLMVWYKMKETRL